MQNERLHENEHNKCLVAVVTLGKKLCHNLTPAAAFLSPSTAISSWTQLDLITENRLYH